MLNIWISIFITSTYTIFPYFTCRRCCILNF
nr:MAG TPA: hypothetical protein [Caudoviricetes sp.]